MSQNGTTPTTDENRAPATIPTSLFVPMMPMFFPYGNASAPGHQYYPPPIYPNVPTYLPNGNHRHGNVALNYNTFYAPLYPTQNGILPPATHMSNSSVLTPLRPLMPLSPYLPPPPPSQQQYSSAGSAPIGKDNERNKNLNIRECQSPVINEAKREKKTLPIIDPNDHNTLARIRENSSSTSSLVSHPEFDPNLPLPRSSSCSSTQEIDSDNPPDDFLTFIEQKTKTTTRMPELNPFANEFSFVNNKTLSNESSGTINGIDHHTSTEHQSSYRLLFDNLIEKSLESIEAIKQSTKKASVNDISVQCDQIDDCINRSTQTIDQTNHSDLITDYSLRTVKLMDKLLEHFRSIYQNELHNEYTTTAQTCDELRHLILFIHRIASSYSDNQKQARSSSDFTNPFSDMVHDLANDMTNMNRYRMAPSAGRGTRRLMTITSNSPVPSFSCRQIDPIVRSKLCLLCQHPLDHSDDVMHKLCQSLSTRPNMSMNT